MDSSVELKVKEFLRHHGVDHVEVSDDQIDNYFIPHEADGFKGGWLLESSDEGLKILVRRWTGECESTVIKAEALTPLEKKAAKAKRRADEKATQKRHEQVRDLMPRVLERFVGMKPNRPSEYLVSKNLELKETVGSAFLSAGLDDNRTVLVVPMYGEDLKVWNVQTIWAVGKGKKGKFYHPGARKKGLFHPIIGANGQSKVLLGEGYATCLAAHMASGLTAYVAFDCGNMEEVLRGLLVKGYEASQVVLLVDWDVPKQTGLRECVRLVEKYSVSLAMPYPKGSIEQTVSVDCADVWASWYANDLKTALTQTMSVGQLEGLKKYIEAADETPSRKTKTPDVCSSVEMGAECETAAPCEVGTDGEEGAGGVSDGGVISTARLPVKPLPEYQQFEPDPSKYPSKPLGFHTLVINVRKDGPDRYAPNYADFAAYMVEKYAMKSTDGILYAYGDGYYQAWSDLKLKNAAKKYLRRNTAPNIIRGMCEMVTTEAFQDRDAFKTPEGFINLANGVLNVRTREIVDHGPEYFFKYKLPHIYDPNAQCPAWKKFLLQTFSGNADLVALSAEIFGWVLIGGSPLIHTAVFLKGEGRNGKGVWLDTLKALIGDENWSAVPLDQLEKPFAMVQANGKLANIVTEVSTKLIESQAFKTAVSGEAVVAAFKGKDEFKFDFHARMILAANKTPYMGDSTTGTHEKFLVLPFDRYVEKHERVLNYVGKFIYPELSGVINWALDGLDRMVKRGRFMEVDAVNQSIDEMRKELDPFYEWWSSHVELGTPEKPLVRGDLNVGHVMFENYAAWCDQRRCRALHQNAFAKKVVLEAKKCGLSLIRPNNKTTLRGEVKLHSKPVLSTY